MTNVHYLHGEPTLIEQFIRIGHSGHRQLENLNASKRFPVSRAVFEAAYLPHQTDLMKILRQSGVEIVLDTNMAETATPGRFETMAKTLEWANKDRPWAPDDFAHGANRDTAAQIAEFAVKNAVNAVLAGTHLLGREGPLDEWFNIDRSLCFSLREALDAAGGREIAIDYPLLIPYSVFLDEALRHTLIIGLKGMPFDNLWIRTANFGRDATAAGFQKFTVGLFDFHKLGKPIVADGVGGLIGLGAAAFGSVGGICHGVAEKERFDPRSWGRRRKSNDGGGQTRRIYFRPLDRFYDAKTARLLLNTPFAKTFLACNDPVCCPLGEEDMLRDHKGHFLLQRARQLKDLSGVPDTRKAGHFVEKHLSDADRRARKAAKLRLPDGESGQALAKSLKENSVRLDNFRRVAETLLETAPKTTRSLAPVHRGKRANDSAQGRR